MSQRLPTNSTDIARHVRMIGGWLRRIFWGSVGRVEALEHEVSAMRTALATMAHQMPLEAERAQQMSRALNELRNRLSSLETRASFDQDLLRSAAEDLRRLEEKAEADRDDLVKLRTALSRLERELQHSAKQAADAMKALFQRIESLRRSQTDRECPQRVTPT